MATATSKSLSDLLAASPPRVKAVAIGHMRERLAAAIRGVIMMIVAG